MANVTTSRLTAFLLTLTGTAAAFGVASCCALPLILYGLGIGSAGLAGIAVLATPFRTPLLIAAAACLLAGAAVLWHQRRNAARCGPGEACARPAAPNLTVFGLAVGLVLLVLGYVYV
ncbi:MAG TPA: mercuric transporter MerT family protein [Alphaproteobacteria bacterium]